MSLDSMEIDFRIDYPLCTLPCEHATDEFQAPLSDNPASMELLNPVDEEPTREYIMPDEYDSAASTFRTDALALLSENVTIFDEHAEFSRTLEQGTIGTEAYVPMVLSPNPSELPTSTLSITLQNAIPALPVIVPQALQPQLLQEIFSPLPESLTQSAPDTPVGQFVESYPSFEQACQEPLFSQEAGLNWDYHDVAHFLSNTSVLGEQIETQDTLVASLHGTQSFSLTTPETEMYLPEAPKITPSEIDYHFLSTKYGSNEAAMSTDCAQKDLSAVDVLELHRYRGFLYSKVRIHNPAVCPSCNQTFADATYLENHIKRDHNNKSKSFVRCPQCSLTLRNDTNLKRHIKHVHRPDKIVDICEICNAKFSSFSSATSHRRIEHGIQPSNSQKVSPNKMNCFFHCETCGSYTKEKGNMTRHVNIVHLQQRNFHCECGKAFKTKHNLDCHKVSGCC